MHLLFLPDATATEDLGRTIGRHLTSGHFVALHGELGAGKTCLARGVARGLGVQGAIPSPTYILVALYPGGRVPLCHADWYRLADVDELEQLGWEDVSGGDWAVLVEWPDRVPEALPPHRLDVHLSDGQTSEGGVGRTARLVAHGALHDALLASATASVTP